MGCRPGAEGRSASRSSSRLLRRRSEEKAVSDRPFAVLGLQQIAVGARSKAALRKLWIDLLGLRPKGNFRSESENVDEDIAEASRRSTTWGCGSTISPPP
jgi:hypothetical protein